MNLARLTNLSYSFKEDETYKVLRYCDLSTRVLLFTSVTITQYNIIVWVLYCTNNILQLCCTVDGRWQCGTVHSTLYANCS